MLHSRGDRNHQQRRVFRGRGGPTDGNLPPKKTARPRVKYQPEQNQAGSRGSQRRADEDPGESDREVESAREICGLDRSVQNISVDDDASGECAPRNEKLLLEVRHLEKRIQNVRLSLQTCRGLSNPKIWRTNCLLPVRNVVREWRSILSYHGGDDEGGRNENGSVGENGAGARDVDLADRERILGSASREVFGLVQMSVQTGPLTGSNPGYFKRCGGEVASMAFEFLGEIAEISNVDEEKVDSEHEERPNGGDGDGCSEGDDLCEAVAEVAPVVCQKAGEQLEHRPDGCEMSGDLGNCDNSSGSDDESLSESCSSSSSIREEDAVVGSTRAQLDATLPGGNAPPSTCAARSQTIYNLQTALLFTEKQALRFGQWHRNAEKAAEKNEPPSKSAKKLQNQKSKKQKQKELKMERKTKKEKRSGR